MDVQPHLLNLSAYINQNLEKDLPLSSLAKRVGLSPFHFHRKFGAYFGESLHQHIKRLRLERAAFALTHGTVPVRQIAKESGYKTVSAFSHAFSGFAGESPTKYRGQSSNDSARADGADEIEPAWIGSLPAQDIAFVRAEGHGRGRQPSVAAALDLIASRIGGANGTETGDLDGKSSNDDDFGYVAATSDVYGVSRTGDFRIDVGLDADRLPADLARWTLRALRLHLHFRSGGRQVLQHLVEKAAERRRGTPPRPVFRSLQGRRRAGGGRPRRVPAVRAADRLILRRPASAMAGETPTYRG